MKTNEMIELIRSGTYDEIFLKTYMDKEKVASQKYRYIKAIDNFRVSFADADIEIYSAPGRSEIGGNHTDHQHGKVLAASINKDAIAVVEKIEEPYVEVISKGYDKLRIELDDLSKKEDEKETTIALIRGVLSKVKDSGFKVGGFKAYVTSDVLIGAGLSSSAAFETLIGTIVSNLYNDGKITAVDIAIIGQYAENEYFGKPCGLMDQMACSVGSLVNIDFEDVNKPKVERVECDLESHGFSLCITDTKGSHADLTSDYAAIPEEMKSVARCLGKDVLGNVTKRDILNNITEIRKKVSDRALLRALHYVCENERVEKEVEALKNNQFSEFLALVKESGDSSYKYLQNVFTCNDIEHQNVSIALAVSEMVLGKNGLCRVHGGGFEGTIQAFVPNNLVKEYKEAMDEIFGKDACDVMKIRKYGGIRIL